MEINMNPDVRIYWTAAVIYGVAALLYIFALLRKEEKLANIGIKFAWVGFIVHATGTLWPAITHQYTHICSFYKVIGGTVMMGMFVFLGASLAKKAVKPGGLLILPITFGLMVLGGAMPCHPLGPSPVYKGWQLWGHVTGGGLNYGFALLAAAMGVLYLLKERGKTGYPYDQIAELEVLDRLNYRFILVAFIMAATMVVFANVWAYMKFGLMKKTILLGLIVWGFVSIYAVSLGLRWFLHWSGRRLAIYSPVALLLVFMFLFYLAPFKEKNYHSGPFFPPYNLDGLETQTNLDTQDKVDPQNKLETQSKVDPQDELETQSKLEAQSDIES
jgi:ABC-type transport system involved in cytochrome c biogenesis permease subunit